jgi:hypothetical protein
MLDELLQFCIENINKSFTVFDEAFDKEKERLQAVEMEGLT